MVRIGLVRHARRQAIPQIEKIDSRRQPSIGATSDKDPDGRDALRNRAHGGSIRDWNDDGAFGSKATTRGRAVKMTTSSELDRACKIPVARTRSSAGQGHSRAAGADNCGPPALAWLRRRRGQLSRDLPKSADIVAGRPQCRHRAQVAVHRRLVAVVTRAKGCEAGPVPPPEQASAARP